MVKMTAKEYLQNKYPVMKEHWNQTNIDDDWAAQMMEEYASLKQKWVSVKAELPEEGIEVIVFIPIAPIPITTLSRFKVEDSTDFYWSKYIGAGWYKDHSITHWMPLPEKPQDYDKK